MFRTTFNRTNDITDTVLWNRIYELAAKAKREEALCKLAYKDAHELQKRLDDLKPF